MKKYAITLLVLTLIGIVLTFLFVTQDEKLDQTVFIDTTESIRNLQSLDKNLLVLLDQSRFNSKFDHELLLETNYQLSEEFSNLRYEALFEEIESSQTLSTAINNFDDGYASREQELDIYVDSNGAVSEALGVLIQTTQDIQAADLGTASAPVNGLLGKTNAQVFAMALNNQIIDSEEIIDQLNDLKVEAPTEFLSLFDQYTEAVTQIVDNSEEAEISYKALTSLDTGSLLDAIEEEYVTYHNQAISGSTLFLNALVGYGVILLGALVFFAAQIRRNYLFLEQEVADRTDEIQSAYKELQESQEQLIQSEKMASLGQMVAGVAHEINTPLGYVSSNIETLKYNVDDMSEVVKEVGKLLETVTKKDRNNKEITQQMMQALQKYKEVEASELVNESGQLLGDGAYGLTEISKLVVSLKDFARLDRQSSEQINIHNCIESSLTIASNHIRENNVTVVKNYAELPNISCVPSKLNQLFLNIITNACQAIGRDGGELTINSQLMGDHIRLDFIDQGAGMDEETKQKMFDPFFTSKEIGVGTGLGMSIAYKIIQAHNGHIEVESELGKGTTLSIILPAQ